MSESLTTSEVVHMIERLESYINDLQIIPATAFYRSKVLLTLLSKSFTVSRAVCALVDAGYTAEAFGLSRTLIEIFIAMRYITNAEDQTERHATLYVEYIAKTQEALLQSAAKFFPGVLVNTTRRGEMEEMTKNYKSAHRWGEVIRAMALEKDNYETNGMGQPIDQAFDYEFIYPQASFYVHATIQSLVTHMTENGEPFRIRANRLRDVRVDKAVFNALVFPAKTVVSAFRGLREDPPQNILDEMYSLMRG
jgi:Family of unknown function (DUF5677)